MSNPVSRGMPSSLAPRPLTMLRRERSLTSRTRFQVMPWGSMPKRVLIVEVVVHHGGQEVVGGGHRVQVPGEVEIEVLERDDLAVPAASGAALDAEGRAHGGLADGDGGLPPDAGQRLAQADRRGRLALAERCRGHRGHDDVAGTGSLGPARPRRRGSPWRRARRTARAGPARCPSARQCRRSAAAWRAARSRWQGGAAPAWIMPDRAGSGPATTAAGERAYARAYPRRTPARAKK